METTRLGRGDLCDLWHSSQRKFRAAFLRGLDSRRMTKRLDGGEGVHIGLVSRQKASRGHSGNHAVKFSFFFSVNAMNNNVTLFFSFIGLLIMYTEQFFKYAFNCVFQFYLELKLAPLKIRREWFQLTDSSETKKTKLILNHYEYHDRGCQN